MASHLVHFGADHCHRLPVLKMAGYDVEECCSESELRAALSAEPAPQAVLVTEETAAVEAEFLAQARMLAPLVLFRQTHRTVRESAFALVVPALEPPANWLAELQSLLAKCRANRAQSKILVMQSVQLRKESAAVRARSEQERRRSRRECGRKPQAGAGFVSAPKSSQKD